MKTKYRQLAVEQLDGTLGQFEHLKSAVPPARGWIRAIRDALGMSGRQLAGRMGVNQQRVARMERDEMPGKITVRTLRETAEALDCVFVYGFVPKSSLAQTIRNQAAAAAQKQFARSNHSMRLEQQELNPKEKQNALKRLIDELVRTMPRTLWDKQ